MTDPQKRKQLFYTNKYQKQILFLAIFPALFICLLTSILVMIFQRELIEVVLYRSAASSIRFLQQWCILIMVSLWILFTFILMWSYKVSLQIVGAFERILRDLDDVIDGKKKGKIHARKNDELANRLLNRINVLIERIK